MNYETALGIAATAWCHPNTRKTVMDTEIADNFARILQREVAKASNYVANKVEFPTSITFGTGMNVSIMYEVLNGQPTIYLGVKHT